MHTSLAVMPYQHSKSCGIPTVTATFMVSCGQVSSPSHCAARCRLLQGSGNRMASKARRALAALVPTACMAPATANPR